MFIKTEPFHFLLVRTNPPFFLFQAFINLTDLYSPQLIFQKTVQYNKLESWRKRSVSTLD